MIITNLQLLVPAIQDPLPQLIFLLGPLVTLFPGCLGMVSTRIVIVPTSMILARSLSSVGMWSALGILLQLLQSRARSWLTQQRPLAARMLLVAGPRAACSVTSRMLIQSGGACEFNSDMQWE